MRSLGSKGGDDPLDGFAEWVDSVRVDWQGPGLAVGVVEDDSLIFARGFGLRDVENRLPVTTRTIFQIGSTTKAFTSMIAGILADDGVVDLDEPLIEGAPDFRLFDDYVTTHTTLRDILCHRTGLPPYCDMVWLLTRMSREDLFHRLRCLEPGAGFRDRFAYSNVGYSVVGTVLEEASGLSWEDLVRCRILDPLGMERTGFGVRDSPLTDDVAWGYRIVDGEPVPVPLAGTIGFENSALIGPAGSMSSTLDDMVRWLRLHLSDGIVDGVPIVSEGTLSEMHGPQMAIRDAGYRTLMQADVYGLGWALSDYRGRRVVSHGGNIEGYSSMVSLMPELGLGVVVLSNTLDFLGHVVSRNVYDRFLNAAPRDWSTELREIFSGLLQATDSARQAPAPDPEALPCSPLSTYAGIYENPLLGRVEVAVGEERLLMVFESGVGATLHHAGLNRFRGTTRELYLPSFSLAFRTDGADRITGLDLTLQPGAGSLEFLRAGGAEGKERV